MKLTASMFVTALLFSAPSAGFAADLPGEAQADVRVSFHDLNLNDQTDARRLLGRIQRAAFDACGASPGSVPEFRALTIKSKCYKDGVESAVRRINSPVLSALYEGDASTRLAAR